MEYTKSIMLYLRGFNGKMKHISFRGEIFCQIKTKLLNIIVIQ